MQFGVPKGCKGYLHVYTNLPVKLGGYWTEQNPSQSADHGEKNCAKNSVLNFTLLILKRH